MAFKKESRSATFLGLIDKLMTGSGTCISVILYLTSASQNVSPEAQSTPNRAKISPAPHSFMSYISAVLNEVSRNHYEQETIEQYEYFRQNLELMRQDYANQTSGFNPPQCGKSPKLKALERLLNNIF